jgi:hypothetical protein
MSWFLHITLRIIYFCFALHIIVFNVYGDFYFNIFNEKTKSELLKEIEKGKNPTSQSEEIDDDYLVFHSDFFNFNQYLFSSKELPKNHFPFSLSTLYSLHYEVLIPPPRV